MLLLKWGCTAKFIASNSIALVVSMETVIRRGHEPMTYHMRGGHTNLLNAVVRKTTTHLMAIYLVYANDMMVLSTDYLSVNLIQSKVY